MPSAFARSADITTAAAAPSDICEEFPAVTVPFTWNAGFSASRASSEVSARGPFVHFENNFLPLGLRCHSEW